MPETRNVSFRYDEPEYSPHAFALNLARLTQGETVPEDTYSRGGAVEELEAAAARLVGKERAIFMPTGTLANHLAVRALAKGARRVLGQEQGHLYNDSGDCLQQLSGINLVPLGRDRAGFTLDEVRDAVGRAGSARVKVDIGAIVIETPVRRRHGEMFDRREMAAICGFARERGIGLHLDGARLFIASAYSGIEPEDYAAPFDTVYLSLYKYFGSPCGAVLAGPAALIDGMYHERRMFGGGLHQAWMFAASAMAHILGFRERFAKAVAASESFKSRLGALDGLSLIDIPNGTNVFRIELGPGRDPGRFIARLEASGVLLPQPEDGGYYLKVNESFLAMPGERLLGCFAEAL